MRTKYKKIQITPAADTAVRQSRERLQAMYRRTGQERKVTLADTIHAACHVMDNAIRLADTLNIRSARIVARIVEDMTGAKVTVELESSGAVRIKAKGHPDVVLAENPAEMNAALPGAIVGH